MSKSKIKYYLIYTLCVFMPLHSMVIDKIIGMKTTGIVNLWRDCIIILLLLISRKLYLGWKQKLACLFIGWIGLKVIYSIAVNASNIYLIFNMARIYIMPILLFVIASSISLTRNEYEKLLQLLWIQGVLLTFFGILQMFVLGSSFLTNLGYGNDGQLNYTYYISGFYGFQRMVSTFSSANDCGLYLAELFVISVVGGSYIKIKYKQLYFWGLIIIYCGIVLTFSRTSLIAATATVILYLIRTNNKKFSVRHFVYGAGVIAFVITMAIVADRVYLNGRIMQMISSSLTSTVKKTDASFLKHLEDLYLPFGDLLFHPFGYNFGTNGPVALSILGRSNTHLVESSIWLIGYESGFIGIVLYYAVTFYYASAMFFRRKNDIEGNISTAIALCDLLAFMTLPYCASFEMPFLMFLFMGLNEKYRMIK